MGKRKKSKGNREKRLKASGWREGQKEKIRIGDRRLGMGASDLGLWTLNIGPSSSWDLPEACPILAEIDFRVAEDFLGDRQNTEQSTSRRSRFCHSLAVWYRQCSVPGSPLDRIRRPFPQSGSLIGLVSSTPRLSLMVLSAGCTAGPSARATLGW